MGSNRTTVYLALSWILSLGIAYVVGWWVGVKNVAHVATNAASSSIWIVLGVLAVVAVLTAVVGFRMRGYLDHHDRSPHLT
jgi:Kef-type K+ transport system membrane component KefB